MSENQFMNTVFSAMVNQAIQIEETGLALFLTTRKKPKRKFWMPFMIW